MTESVETPKHGWYNRKLKIRQISKAELEKIKDRFEDNIFYSPDGCWYWTGARYGNPPRARIFITQKKSVHSSRVSYEMHKGPTTTYLVLHTCDNQLCVNPDHLYLGNNQQNVADKVKRNRCPRGEDSKGSKLTPEKVFEIRSSSDTLSNLSRKLKVSLQSIHAAKIGKTWKHIALSSSNKE